jgi:DNA-binding NarL/FixJ family response regulator
MRILVAVSDTDLRLSLELMLSEEPGVRIAGSVTDTSGLLALVKQTAPDLLLLDWELHGDSIESVLGELQALDCQPKCTVLGRRHSSQDPTERAGADVYITKGDPPERLLGAIRALNA